MNPLVADRKLAWVLPAAVSVIVVATMLLFPYASGYGLGSDPLWRLLLTLWNASDEWKHGMFVFPIAAILIFLKLIGFHSIRDGTAIISAADPVAGIVSGQRYSVDVADPCSGIRSLFALTMISALVGILSFRTGWKVMILFAAWEPSTKLRDGMEKTYRWIYDQMVTTQAVHNSA